MLELLLRTVTRSPWLWLAVAVLVGVGLFAAGGATWSRFIAPGLVHLGTSQLPPDFPIYTPSRLVGSFVSVSDCTYVEVDWQTPDTPEEVLAYYERQMSQAPWQTVAVGEPRTVAFRGSGRDEVFGRVQVTAGVTPTGFRYLGQRPYRGFGQYAPECLTSNPRLRSPAPSTQ